MVAAGEWVWFARHEPLTLLPPRSSAPRTPVTRTAPPTTAQRQEFARQQRELREAYQSKQEQELEKILASPDRMTSLPGWLSRVYVDPSGKAWFVGGAFGEDEGTFR